MTAQLFLPSWLVNHPVDGPAVRERAEEMTKWQAATTENNYDGTYEGRVEWIEHKPNPSWGSLGSLWEVRAW